MCRFDDAGNITDTKMQLVRVYVALPANHFVAIDAELVEEIVHLLARLRDKLRQHILQHLQLVQRHLEIRMERDKTRNAVHAFIVATSSSSVEAPRDW